MDTSLYKLALEHNGVKAYIPLSVDKYHTSRIMQLEHLYIYAQGGATKDVLASIIDEILLRVNSDKYKTERSDIAILCNNIKYRLQYPVDEQACLRMGYVCAFLEVDNEITGEDGKPIIVTKSEDPQQAQSDYWAGIKEQLICDPEWHSFFLHLGVIQYGDLLTSLGTSTELDYFRKRRQALAALYPSNNR
jgi:hypothetical protein